MSIETVHTSAIAVLGVEVSLFRGVAFLPSPPIPINLDKKELIKRTAFSRNQACPDDLVGLYPDINSSNTDRDLCMYLYHTAAFDVLLCAWAQHCPILPLVAHKGHGPAGLYRAIPPSAGPDTDMAGWGGSSHTWPLRGSCAICRFEKWMCHLVWKACDRSGWMDSAHLDSIGKCQVILYYKTWNLSKILHK